MRFKEIQINHIFNFYHNLPVLSISSITSPSPVFVSCYLDWPRNSKRKLMLFFINLRWEAWFSKKFPGPEMKRDVP